MTNPRRLAKPAILSISIGICVYAVAIIANDFSNIYSAAVKLGAAGWLTILALSLCNYGLRLLRWHAYMQRLGHRLALGRQAAYYLAGFAFTTTPAKTGEAVRGWYLKRHSVGYRHTFACIFVERLLDVTAVALLTGLAAYSISIIRWPVAIMAVLLFAGLWSLHGGWPQRLVTRWQASTSNARIHRSTGHLLDTLGHAVELLRTGPLAWGLGIGLLGWVAEGLAFYLILEQIGLAVPLGIVIGIYAASILVGAASFIPGGLGSTEASMVLLLGLAGVDPGAALSATLIARMATLWFAVGIGVLTVAAINLFDQSLGIGQTVTLAAGCKAASFAPTNLANKFEQ